MDGVGDGDEEKRIHGELKVVEMAEPTRLSAPQRGCYPDNSALREVNLAERCMHAVRVRYSVHASATAVRFDGRHGQREDGWGVTDYGYTGGVEWCFQAGEYTARHYSQGYLKSHHHTHAGCK